MTTVIQVSSAQQPEVEPRTQNGERTTRSSSMIINDTHPEIFSFKILLRTNPTGTFRKLHCCQK